MLSKYRLKFVLQVLLPDVIAILLAVNLMYLFRFSSWYQQYLPATERPSVHPYLLMSALCAAGWMFFLYRKGEYSDLALTDPSRLDRYLTLAVCGIKANILLLTVSALYRDFLLSRQVYVLAFLMAVFLLVVKRELLRYWLTRSPSFELVLIACPSHEASLRQALFERIKGLRSVHSLPWLGQPDGFTNRLQELCDQTGASQIFLFHEPDLLPTGANNETFFDVLNFCEGSNRSLFIIPDILDVSLRKAEMYSLTSFAVIRLRDSFIHPVYAVIKRMFDICAALLLLTVGLPLWACLALGVWLQDRGPVFYHQCRIGLHGKPFDMLKFRTMHVGADASIVQKIQNGEFDQSLVFNIRKDDRVTWFGRLLRRSSLDEIPQLWNVLRGEMSLVGPRPERKELVEKYSPVHRRRLKARPGITGLQQVASRGEPDLTKRIEYDLFYLSKQSFVLDMYILLRTISVVIRGNGLS